MILKGYQPGIDTDLLPVEPSVASGVKLLHYHDINKSKPSWFLIDCFLSRDGIT